MIALYSFLGKMVLFGLCRATRFEEINAGYVRNYIFQKKQNLIFAFWHNRLFYMTYFLAMKYVRRGHKVVVFSSYSKDGEIMARLETSLGAAVVRGSTSKGAIEGLINLYRKTQSGFSPVITPDGPRGPKYEVQDGLLFLAQKTSFPVIPVSYTPTKSYRFNSWDNFMIPLPFSRVKVIYGEPIVANTTHSREELRKKIKEALMKITFD
ncbi:MAG: lysophospholipid acyltransferase family protein [Planctomycetota bacterium]|nr:lysophospholipid acyltransferase family protein [Planctomycetota bacterium]MDI6787093.1 lysophospholipid acyltransferase family protein [Planctomycetota bacterium]